METRRRVRAAAVTRAVVVIQRAWRHYRDRVLARRRNQQLRSPPSRNTPSKTATETRSPPSRSVPSKKPITEARPAIVGTMRIRSEKTHHNRVDTHPRQERDQPSGPALPLLNTSAQPTLKRLTNNTLTEDTATRVRVNDGWNDDPHVQPLHPDRFARRLYPPQNLRNKGKYTQPKPKPPPIRKPKEWIF